MALFGQNPILKGKITFLLLAAVAGLIKNNSGDLLLVRRASDPKLRKLDLPGGFVNVGESAEDALFREIKEDLNFEITSCQFIKSQSNEYKYNGVIYYPLDLFFECTVKSFENIKLHDEVSGYFFTRIQELDINLIGFDSVKSVLSWYSDQIYNCTVNLGTFGMIASASSILSWDDSFWNIKQATHS